jgi:hypothetical protein
VSVMKPSSALGVNWLQRRAWSSDRKRFIPVQR